MSFDSTKTKLFSALENSKQHMDSLPALHADFATIREKAQNASQDKANLDMFHYDSTISIQEETTKKFAIYDTLMSGIHNLFENSGNYLAGVVDHAQGETSQTNALV